MFKRQIVGALMLAVMGTSAMAEAQSGAYLAGRAAMVENDFAQASKYLARALVREPGNVAISESAVLANLGIGNFSSALAASRPLLQHDKSNQLARLVLSSEAALNGDYTKAAELLADESVGPLISELAGAWVMIGQGDMSGGIEQLQDVIASDGLRNFGLYHKGLALALAGDLEGADGVFSGRADGAIVGNHRMAAAHARVLSQLGRADDAMLVLEDYLQVRNDPQLSAMQAQLAQQGSLDDPAISTVTQGLAEVYYGLAEALEGEADDVYTLAYARMADYLDDHHTDAVLLAAGVLEALGQYELATKDYDRIARDNPAYLSAEIGRANALDRAEKTDRAVEVLQQLAETYPDVAAIHARLGDMLRRSSEFDDASKAYDRAIELLESQGGASWFIYYTRGITHERLDRWPLAEADFRKALELNPDQPQVLNYIGYSFVELQTNLDEALDMIRKAVELRPQDGYIADSLGWVYYRLGRYEEAVEWMEKSAALTPVDPVINDHLGDVYWAVGRNREARFQWSRAMSFDPEEEDAIRIRRKLEVGLDVVLDEEGAEPLKVADDN